MCTLLLCSKVTEACALLPDGFSPDAAPVSPCAAVGPGWGSTRAPWSHLPVRNARPIPPPFIAIARGCIFSEPLMISTCGNVSIIS